MRSTTARAIALTLTITMSDLVQAQTPAWSLCGAGSYTLTAGGQTIGNETFEITCKPDGKYSATGRTQLTPLGLDLTTALELDASLQQHIQRRLDRQERQHRRCAGQEATDPGGRLIFQAKCKWCMLAEPAPDRRARLFLQLVPHI